MFSSSLYICAVFSYCFQLPKIQIQHRTAYICAVTDLTRALVTLHILSPSCFTPTIQCIVQYMQYRATPCNNVQHSTIMCNTVQYRALYIVQTSSRHRASHQQYTTCINRAFYAVHCPLYIVQTSSCTAVPS